MILGIREELVLPPPSLVPIYKDQLLQKLKEREESQGKSEKELQHTKKRERENSAKENK